MTEPKPRAWRAWLLLALACWLPLAQAAALVPSRAPAREENAYRGFCDETPDLRALARAASREAASGNVACGYENRLGPNCCGEQWDADLGLYFLRARYMNPDSGRFWNMDTFEGSASDPITLHKYLYASANSVTFLDPSGNESLVSLSAASSIQGLLQGGAQISIRYAGKKAGCFIIEYAVAEAVGRGIYMFVDDFGVYVGKSIDVERRLAQHGERIRLLISKIHVVGVSDKQLRQIEQFVLGHVRAAIGAGRDALRATPGSRISNKINPVREFLRKAIKIC